MYTQPAPLYMSTRKHGRYTFKLLFSTWKGSLYKLVWRHLLVWLALYYAISFWYRYGMSKEERRVFEFLCRYCEKYSSLIPLSFVLGFYVNLVVNRFWAMWDSLPWPDNIALFVTTSIQGQDERSRLMRRTIMRYVNLASVHSMSLFSTRVRKRFPTLDHFVQAGLLNENERQILEEQSKKIKKLYFMPLVWAAQIITKARTEGRISSDFQWKSCLDHIVEFRQKCGRSLHIDLINLPLVYSQVVTLAVYTFFLACLLGRQFIQNDKYVMDLYFPVFTVLQFLFYLGWLKVAETLVNPYGEDDDDFELNWMIDRHIKTSYMIVDEMNDSFPDMVKDLYWEQVIPEDLPHTEESQEAELGRTTPDLLGSMLDVPSSFDSAGAWPASFKSRGSTMRRIVSLRNRFSVKGSNRPSSRASNSSQPFHLTPIRERRAQDEKPIIRRAFSSPPTSPDAETGSIGAFSAVDTRMKGSKDDKNKSKGPKRAQSMLDKFKFGSSSSPKPMKKLRVPGSPGQTRLKYVGPNDSVDMLPTVIEAPAFVEAAAQAAATTAAGNAARQPSPGKSQPIRIPAVSRPEIKINIESAPAAAGIFGGTGALGGGGGYDDSPLPSHHLSTSLQPGLTGGGGTLESLIMENMNEEDEKDRRGGSDEENEELRMLH